MPCKFIFVFLILYSSLAAAKQNCVLADALRDPKLNSNAEFWREYSALSERSNGVIPDPVLTQLKDKYRLSTKPENSAAENFFQPSARANIQNRAQKEIDGLPVHLRGKVDEFLATALQPGGMTQIRSNPGRWNLERVNQFGQDSYTIRLNDGYRVLFEMKDDTLVVRRVNKGQIHGN